jgi:hypothetical protein
MISWVDDMPDSKRFLLRLDPRVFVAIRRWADDDLRSVNGQIEWLLADGARRAGRLSHARGRRSSPGGEAPPADSHSDEPEALLVVAGGM